MTFKLNDQVIVGGTALGLYRGKRGRIRQARISELHPSGADRHARYLVDLGHSRRWFNEKDLELAGPMSENFHHGKSVTVNCISSKWHGQRGVIIQSTRVRDRQGKWTHLVEFNPTSRQWFPEYELCSNDDKKEAPTTNQLPKVRFLPPGAVSPIKLNMLLAIFCSPEYANASGSGYITEKTWNSPAGAEARIWLKRNGLINETAQDLTDKGHAWLRAILTVPLPVSHETWEVPNDRA